MNHDPIPTRFRRVPSPLGVLTLAGTGELLTHLALPGDDPASRHTGWRQDRDAFAPVVDQLDAYFAGDRSGFDVALALDGTEFQRQVWAALVEIPYGQTRSYGDIARRIGRPGASRAVGSANNANPVAIIVPCHRVIGADGSLVGYGGGLDRKQHLLDLEAGQMAAMAPRSSRLGAK